MDSGAMWMRMKANRAAYTLSILATLAVGILIGTVINQGVKGKEGQKSDAAPLSMPSPQQMSNAFSQIAKQLERVIEKLGLSGIKALMATTRG